MNKEEINKFPSLRSDNGVANLLSSVNYLSESLKSSEQTLQEHILKIQKKCQHEWYEETRYDKNIPSCNKNSGNIYYGVEVLESKTCTLCGLTENRPAGPSTKICFRCWSPMEYSCQIPGQGEHTSVYECTNPNCQNGSWNT